MMPKSWETIKAWAFELSMAAIIFGCFWGILELAA